MADLEEVDAYAIAPVSTALRSQQGWGTDRVGPLYYKREAAVLYCGAALRRK
jgi:hypothetical protein